MNYYSKNPSLSQGYQKLSWHFKTQCAYINLFPEDKSDLQVQIETYLTQKAISYNTTKPQIIIFLGGIFEQTEVFRRWRLNVKILHSSFCNSVARIVK